MNTTNINRKSSCESITPIYACEDNQLSYETEELYDFVKEWLDDAKLTSTNLASCMKALHLEPQFRDFNKSKETFGCNTSTGENVRINLFSVNMPFPQIVVTKNLDNGLYEELAFNVRKQENSSHVKLRLASRTLNSEERFCEVHHDTILGYTSTTHIRYSKPVISICILPETRCARASKKRIKVALTRLKKDRNFPKFLLDIDTTDSNFVDKIFQEILRILDLPHDDFEKLYMVSVCYVYTNTDGNRQELSQILCDNGKINRYAKIVDGQLYDVDSHGNWHYLGTDMSLDHCERTGETMISCSTDLISDGLHKHISEIEAKTLELRAYLGNNSSLLKT